MTRSLATSLLFGFLVVALLTSSQRNLRADDIPECETSNRAFNTSCLFVGAETCVIQNDPNNACKNLINVKVYDGMFKCQAAPPNPLTPAFGSVCVYQVTKQPDGTYTRDQGKCVDTVKCIFEIRLVNGAPTPGCWPVNPQTAMGDLLTTAPCLVVVNNPDQ